MAIEKIAVTEYVTQADQWLLVDVRSPGEYDHAHMPGALSLPLFSNEERKVVGTAYKQESREKAIKIGLKYFGPKMVKMVEQVEKWLQDWTKTHRSPCKGVVVHCWRGGMRSAGVAWLLDLYGIPVKTIPGGYKSFRHWCLQRFEEDYPMAILGGFTGSGKTLLLDGLKSAGAAIIDLEALASHKGSAFGSIGMPGQPSQEQFENLLALALYQAKQKLTNANSLPVRDGLSALPNLPLIWLEDESQRIGSINIPFVFYKQMRLAPLFMLDIPFEERLEFITRDYGKGQTEKLVNAIIRIQKRLGGLEAKNAINHLMEGNTKECFRILLSYYDKWYEKAMPLHRSVETMRKQQVKGHHHDYQATVQRLLQAASEVAVGT